jgi:hypothetical protein
MNFPFLILPKIINPKGLKLFEFRQLQHLLEILFYGASDFESSLFNKNWGWLGFGGLEMVWPKRAKPYQLLRLHNLESFQSSPTVKQEI